MEKDNEEILSMNIFQRLAKIRKMVEVIRKNKSGFNYKYVSEDEILARVTAGMDKYHVLLYPGIVPKTAVITPYNYTKVKITKSGDKIEESINEVLVNADMTFTWVNLDNPADQLVVPWVIVGQQSDASQAVGSGLSYLHRYFLLKFFQIATPDDDPDFWRSKKKQAEQEEETAVVSAILDEVHASVSAYLDSFSGDDAKEARKKIIAMVKKYAKGEDGKPTGDYFAIHDAKSASALLEDVKKLTGETENAQ